MPFIHFGLDKYFIPTILNNPTVMHLIGGSRVTFFYLFIFYLFCISMNIQNQCHGVNTIENTITCYKARRVTCNLHNEKVLRALELLDVLRVSR